MNDDPLKIAGWREWVSLPDLDIPKIKAKLDTGARSSALNATNIQTESVGPATWVTFDVFPNRRSDESVRCRAKAVDRRTVSDSGGHKEKRWVIETDISMGGQTWPMEMTLTDRRGMKFSLLLGRTALKDRFAVDAGSSYLVSGRKVRRG